MPRPSGLGIFTSLLTAGCTGATRERSTAFSRKPRKFDCSGRYGLLAMGNGHAPGTATGLGIAGAAVAVTGCSALRRWTAGLAVFFFAAFLTPGFLAGFFLAATLSLAADFRAADFLAALLGLAAGFFLWAGDLRADFFFAAFFFAFAMPTSDYVCDSGH